MQAKAVEHRVLGDSCSASSLGSGLWAHLDMHYDRQQEERERARDRESGTGALALLQSCSVTDGPQISPGK